MRMLYKLSDFYEKKKREYRVLPKKYRKRKKTYGTVLYEAKKKLAEIKSHYDTDAKLRIAYISGRVKSLHSIVRKAFRNNIPVGKAFDSIDDIVGIRIVVNNLRDIKPLLDEIRKIPEFNLNKPKKRLNKRGYRAIHVKAVYTLDTGDGKKEDVACEIQIRSLLQDAWAILSHHDVYKNKAQIPKLAKSISENMSSVLDALDKMADDFRREIETKVEPPNDLSESAPLDKEGVAFLYYETFGEKPEEYEVQYLSKLADEYAIESVGKARKGLKEEVFDNLRKIHDKRFPVLDVTCSDLFEFGLLYSLQGVAAYRKYRKRIKEEWAEIEATARGEALSGMPETFDEFVELLENDEVPWEAIGELGGTKDCYRCGNEIISLDSAVEGILDYYDDPGTKLDLRSMLWDIGGRGDGPEIESVDFPGACPYCGYQMSKDD